MSAACCLAGCTLCPIHLVEADDCAAAPAPGHCLCSSVQTTRTRCWRRRAWRSRTATPSTSTWAARSTLRGAGATVRHARRAAGRPPCTTFCQFIACGRVPLAECTAPTLACRRGWALAFWWTCWARWYNVHAGGASHAGLGWADRIPWAGAYLMKAHLSCCCRSAW